MTTQEHAFQVNVDHMIPFILGDVLQRLEVNNACTIDKRVQSFTAREQSTPLKRMATTDDVVAAVRFSLSDETSF